MIPDAFQFITNLLQQHLKNRFGLDQDCVVCNSIIDADGSIPQMNQNKVVLSLINIEREMSKSFTVRNQKLSDGNQVMKESAARYNFDILLSSNFDDYTESLKFLNEILLFFQDNSSIDARTSSNIPKGITKLLFEFENNTYHQLHAFWNTMGAKYSPSAIYKMRLIASHTSEITDLKNAVIKTSNEVKP